MQRNSQLACGLHATVVYNKKKIADNVLQLGKQLPLPFGSNLPTLAQDRNDLISVNGHENYQDQRTEQWLQLFLLKKTFTIQKISLNALFDNCTCIVIRFKSNNSEVVPTLKIYQKLARVETNQNRTVDVKEKFVTKKYLSRWFS